MDYKEKNKEFFSLYFIILTEKTLIDYKEKKLDLVSACHQKKKKS